MPLPLPITGFLKKCLHDKGHHHGNRGQSFVGWNQGYNLGSHYYDSIDQDHIYANTGDVYSKNGVYNQGKMVKYGLDGVHDEKYDTTKQKSKTGKNGVHNASDSVQHYMNDAMTGVVLSSPDTLPSYRIGEIGKKRLRKTAQKSFGRAKVHGGGKYVSNVTKTLCEDGKYTLSRHRHVSDSTTDSEQCMSDHVNEVQITRLTHSLSIDGGLQLGEDATNGSNNPQRILKKQASSKTDTGGYDSDISSGLSEEYFDEEYSGADNLGKSSSDDYDKKETSSSGDLVKAKNEIETGTGEEDSCHIL